MDRKVELLLKEQQKKKKLITNEYLVDPNNENYKYIAEKFFKGQEDKINILNTGSGLFACIANVISNYTGDIIFDIDFPIQKVVEDYVCFGKGIMALSRKDNNIVVQYIPAENHIYLNKKDYIYRAYAKVNDFGQKDFYILETTYLGGIIENKLYKKSGLLDYELKPLSEIEETKDLPDYLDTGFNKVLFVIQDDELEDNPISIIDKVKNIVYSIDRKILMFDLEFLKNVENFILLKGIQLPNELIKQYDEGNKINFSDLGRIVQGEEASSIEFIKNTNELIKEAIKYEETQIKKISALTTIPLDFLGGNGTAGAIGEGSRELLHGAFIKTIQNIRKLIDKTVVKMIEIISKEIEITPFYSWNDVFSKNTKQLMEEIEKALNLGIISKRTRLKRYLNLTEKEIDLEFNLLANENKVGGNTE